jgi:uncharacterized protein DUF4198
MVLRMVLAVCAAVSAGIPLRAHDFWLAANPWVPESRVTISAHVGEHFPNGTEFTTPDRVGSWRVLGPGGEVAPDGFRRDANSLVADVVLPSPGAYLATMTVLPRVTTMKGPLFTSYLLEEGLEWVLAARLKAGVSEDTATERFARYAKVALRNGFGTGAHLSWPVGFPAEFVPMTDPTLLRAGQLLTFQLLADRKPVSGAVVAARASNGGHPILGRTDSTGHVTLQIDREGAWLVRTVHMVTGAQAGVPEVEWDSYWATFAFHTAGR